ncbi:MAG: hypothetical protein ACRCUT_02485, partial [Spirochaetota bacterium]
PVEISVTVKNCSGKTASFSMYDVFYTTYQPVAYTMDGREAETVVQYRRMNRMVQDVVEYIEPRQVRLAPDEKIVKRIDLKNCYTLATGNQYRVRGFFMADAKSPSVVRSENSIEINIIPVERDIDAAIELPAQYSGSITPAEVVSLFLSAEKSRRWNNMLKFIQLEKFIQVYPDYGMSYNTGNDPLKRKVLRDFVTYLSTPRKDYIVDYTAVNESILEDRKTAYVDVKVTRFSAPKPFVYIYRYTLEDNGRGWLITGVDATVSKERILAK